MASSRASSLRSALTDFRFTPEPLLLELPQETDLRLLVLTEDEDQELVERRFLLLLRRKCFLAGFQKGGPQRCPGFLLRSLHMRPEVGYGRGGDGPLEGCEHPGVVACEGSEGVNGKE